MVTKFMLTPALQLQNCMVSVVPLRLMALENVDIDCSRTRPETAVMCKVAAVFDKIHLHSFLQVVLPAGRSFLCLPRTAAAVTCPRRLLRTCIC